MVQPGLDVGEHAIPVLAEGASEGGCYDHRDAAAALPRGAA